MARLVFRFDGIEFRGSGLVFITDNKEQKFKKTLKRCIHEMIVTLRIVEEGHQHVVNFLKEFDQALVSNKETRQFKNDLDALRKVDDPPENAGDFKFGVVWSSTLRRMQMT